MVNHIRTLLLNRPQDSQQVGDFGWQYIPKGSLERQLPQYLRDIRRTLFGSSPDSTMLNYRLHQFTTLLHATELAEHVVATDARITYHKNPVPEIFNEDSYTPRVSGLTDPRSVSIVGDPTAPDQSGKMRHVFQLNPASLVTTGGSSELGDSGYNIRLVTSATDTTEISVSVINRPQWDLGQLVMVLESGSRTADLQLFGLRPEEPYLTYRNLWRSQESLPHRLGAYLLAVALRTEEVSNA